MRYYKNIKIEGSTNSVLNKAKKKTAPNLRFKGGFLLPCYTTIPPQKIKIEEKMSKRVKMEKDKKSLAGNLLRENLLFAPQKNPVARPARDFIFGDKWKK